MSQDASTPKWFWPVLIALASIEPATHVWIAYFPPGDAVPTGMHIGDSSHHLLCMRMFDTDFYSPFATCRAERGAHYFGYFAPPIFLLYGVLGLLRKALGIDAFLFLGFANGVGGALYLASAYRFLREAVPRLANRAFLLFALGGGLGGVLYLITGVLGWHAAPSFEEYFRRYAHYELIEGPHLSPVLLMPRLYYTLPMALALLGLAAVIRAERGGRKRDAGAAAALLAAATFLNLRIGPPAWAIAALYLVCRRQRGARQRAWLGCLMALAVAVGGAAAWRMICMSPTYSANLKGAIRMSMWLSPFASAVLFHFLTVPRAVRRDMAALPKVLYVGAWALLGYLGAFALLYLGYQAYYGNVWRCLDVMVAVRMSDWALLGAPAGAGYALWRSRSRTAFAGESETGWVTLWLLSFLGIALSAFGQGWFMQFNPQRLMVFLGLPVAILSAKGLAQIAAARPRFAAALTAVIVACGVCSIAVGALCFQGPLGRVPGKGPFAYLHYETMTQTDAHMLDRLKEGVVVTPPWSPIAFGEIVALRPNVSVVGSVGAMNISDQLFGPLQDQVNAFFDAHTPDGVRRDFARQWCLDYVYCPEMCPVDKDVAAQLRGADWLQEVASENRAALFEVIAE